MAKSLTMRIAERAAKKKTSLFAQNRAAFLILRKEIEEALTDGWSVKTIWELLHEEGKISFSYQSFRNYVNDLILNPKSRIESETPTQTIKEKTNDPTSEKKSHHEKQQGFVFNPVPNKEELI